MIREDKKIYYTVIINKNRFNTVGYVKIISVLELTNSKIIESLYFFIFPDKVEYLGLISYNYISVNIILIIKYIGKNTPGI